ncbi:hypothetical protein BGZ94_003601 [Podila epigama]|nr:hypothetical protein BGZ94_003601 [Podila epigama]
MSPSLSAASSTANNSSATMATGATSLSTFGNQTGSGGAPTAPVASSNVSEQKLKRFLEHNQRLKEQLDMRRISVSEAGQRL